jgi:hypothetical protein
VCVVAFVFWGVDIRRVEIRSVDVVECVFVGKIKIRILFGSIQ